MRCPKNSPIASSCRVWLQSPPNVPVYTGSRSFVMFRRTLTPQTRFALAIRPDFGPGAGGGIFRSAGGRQARRLRGARSRSSGPRAGSPAYRTCPAISPRYPACILDGRFAIVTEAVIVERRQCPSHELARRPSVRGGTMATDPSMKARSCSIVRKRSVCRVTTILQFLPLRKWGGGGLGACSCSPGVGFGPSLHAHFTLDSSVK